jgi:hypothetical protein
MFSSCFLPPDFSFEFNIAPRRIPAYCPVGVRPRKERARANCGAGDVGDIKVSRGFVGGFPV